MSQVLAESPPDRAAATSGGFRNSLDPAETEFAYRPIPMSAIIGGVMALLSISALLMWLAIPLAVVAAFVSLFATVTILRSRGELAGLTMALSATVFSLAMAVSGVLLTIHRYKAELPPGYERVSFARDISGKGVGQQAVRGGMAMIIPDSVRELEGKPIYLKGFIYPTARAYDLTEFILCKDNDQCCMGGQPEIQDMIGVTLKNKQTTNYTKSLTGVAGILKVNPDYHGGSLEPIYLMEAEFVAPAQTSL